MVTLQYFTGKEWIRVGGYANDWIAWVSLGTDNQNYRTIDSNGKVITDKSVKDKREGAQ